MAFPVVSLACLGIGIGEELLQTDLKACSSAAVETLHLEWSRSKFMSNYQKFNCNSEWADGELP